MREDPESRVTLAIPTLNRVGYLRQALESAFSQNYTNLEIIVSDNCSTDGTEQFLSTMRDKRLVVLRQSKNIGMIGNWNACLQRATGKYFLLLSDDDLLAPEAIRKLVSAIENAANPGTVAFAYCRCWVIDSLDKPISLDPIAPLCEGSNEFVLGFFSKRREVRPCSTLFRTGDVRDIGGYAQGDVELAVDAIVWSRILQKRRFVASLQEPLAKYRVHPSNLSSVQSIRVWQKDLRRLAEFWIADFQVEAPRLRGKLLSATRGHEAWMIGVIINQSATSYVSRVRLLSTYFNCRSSFIGIPGIFNLVTGLLKLLVPAFIKKPIRDFLVWRQPV